MIRRSTFEIWIKADCPIWSFVYRLFICSYNTLSFYNSKPLNDRFCVRFLTKSCYTLKLCCILPQKSIILLPRFHHGAKNRETYQNIISKPSVMFHMLCGLRGSYILILQHLSCVNNVLLHRSDL